MPRLLWCLWNLSHCVSLLPSYTVITASQITEGQMGNGDSSPSCVQQSLLSFFLNSCKMFFRLSGPVMLRLAWFLNIVQVIIVINQEIWVHFMMFTYRYDRKTFTHYKACAENTQSFCPKRTPSKHQKAKERAGTNMFWKYSSNMKTT